ncbi:unnamed protein product [Allacma fusca]|uniref:Uncharacterized protein n=1 Tax=Allacma fusca TaxID=39272 RepID=A0A8J2JQM5_9HEXA|nr:unnamed protein product [Allacma fusca]
MQKFNFRELIIFPGILYKFTVEPYMVLKLSDFTQQLSQQHEQHAVELQLLVDNFRKRNAELRKERPPCSSSLFQVWETLLQEVEIDSQAHSDLSGSLGRQVS